MKLLDYLGSILIPVFLLLATSYAAADSFTCNYGQRPACLGYNDKVFDSSQCDYRGFSCKSKFDELIDEYNQLVNKSNDAIRKNKELISIIEKQQNEIKEQQQEIEEQEDKIEEQQQEIEELETKARRLRR